MRIAMVAAAACLAGVMGVDMAQAAPMNVAPLGPTSGHLAPTKAVQQGPAPEIELVRGGCGIGRHRDYYGYCHRNHWRGRRYWHHGRWWWHRWW